MGLWRYGAAIGNGPWAAAVTFTDFTTSEGETRSRMGLDWSLGNPNVRSKFLMDPSDPMSEIDMQRYMKWVDAGTSSPVMQDLKELIDSPLKIGYGAEYEWSLRWSDDGTIRDITVGIENFMNVTVPVSVSTQGGRATYVPPNQRNPANGFRLRRKNAGAMYGSYANTIHTHGTTQGYPPLGYDGWVNIPPGRWYERVPNSAGNDLSEVPRSEFVWHELWEVYKRAGGLQYEPAHDLANAIAGRTGSWLTPGTLAIYVPLRMPNR